MSEETATEQRTLMTFVFDVTGFTPEEADALSGEIQAQGESGDTHGSAHVVAARTDGPALVEAPKLTAVVNVTVTGRADDWTSHELVRVVYERLEMLDISTGLAVHVEPAGEGTTVATFAFQSVVEARWVALALFDRANDLEGAWPEPKSAMAVKIARLRATAASLWKQTGGTISDDGEAVE